MPSSVDWVRGNMGEWKRRLTISGYCCHCCCCSRLSSAQAAVVPWPGSLGTNLEALLAPSTPSPTLPQVPDFEVWNSPRGCDIHIECRAVPALAKAPVLGTTITFVPLCPGPQIPCLVQGLTGQCRAAHATAKTPRDNSGASS